MTLFVSELWHYPLKSAQGESLSGASWSGFGLADDRRWVLIDPTGHFVSQRSCAAMGALAAHAQDTRLTLTWQGQSVLAHALPELPVMAEVWGDHIAGWGVAPAVNQQLSVLQIRVGRSILSTLVMGTSPHFLMAFHY